MIDTSHTGPAAPHVVGVDIGGSNLRVALAGPGGHIVARRRVSTRGVRDAACVVDLIAAAVEALLVETGLEPTALHAIGAGAPGVTDVQRGIVIATSYLMGWRDVPLRDMLESKLALPAAVDNDVNLAALGESRAGAAVGVDDFVFLAIGTGVGAGIVLDHHLHRGRGWRAGEIGYMLVPGASEAPVDAGAPGAFEELAGGEGIQKRWRSLWQAGRTALPAEATPTAIFDAAQSGDALAVTVLETTARSLSYAIYNMALLLNCPLFVLGGSVGLHPALRDRAGRLLDARDNRTQLCLVPSRLGDDAQLCGAIHLALETAG